MAEPQKLCVQMLGKFGLIWNGEPLDLDLGNTKRQQLLMLLLFSGPKGITREQLIDALYGNEEGSDVSNSLKALMFRLRRQMQANLPDGERCIRYFGGAYHWNGPEYRLDAREFQKAAAAALKGEDSPQTVVRLLRAVKLYTGEFLPELIACEWVSIINTQLSNLFCSCVRRTAGLLEQTGDAQRQLQLFDWACRLEPAQEEWQLGRVDALTALGRNDEALDHYNEYVKFLFDTLGVTPDAALLERLEKISGQLRQPSAGFDTICNKLKDPNAEGAFYCSYPHFRDNYRILGRIIARTGQSAFLVLSTITNVHGEVLQEGPRLEDAMARLGQVIGETLRTSDIYTRYSNNQFLLLLIGLHQEDCGIVTDRLGRSFADAKESWGFRIQSRAMPVTWDGPREKTTERFVLPEQWQGEAGPKENA